MPYLLVLEADQKTATGLRHVAESLGYGVGVVDEVKKALLVLQQRPVAALIIDLAVFEAQKNELIQASTHAAMPVIVLTDYDAKPMQSRAQRLGALCVVNRGHCLEYIEPILSQVLETIYNEKYGVGAGIIGRDFGQFVGQSKAMQQLYYELERVAKTDIAVMLLGESGTGKELAALALHQYSDRQQAEFLPLNCGAISTQLIESELFGHEKGSFTGADKARQGYFELADQGTLFLDEITEMPLDMQVSLLRVLETGHFMRVGGNKPLNSNARIVAATNRDPLKAVADKKLREDLYYRLNVFPVNLPPLRERDDDVVLLAQHFLAQINAQHQTEKQLSADSLLNIQQYQWPGNVRELRNIIWRSYVLAANDQVEVLLP